MPLIGGLLSNLFVGLVNWFAQYLGRKLAFGVSAVAAMTALTAALFVFMRGVVGPLLSQLDGTSGIFMDALQMAVPIVAPACLSTYVTVWTACTVYTWQRDLIHLFAKAG
ncbi:DUF5455 family protein [Comamonas sp.]|uniref:DUF5455 family protein n=1 Tax=unclassified Comamonas TaxID=2638500 RepID=UPI002647C19A|nr:DUF5455 family protein [Comamonas sp.]MDN5506772.1 minor coat protein [Comamonas sp.]MDN5539968.1 minor coat protein [Comamonas sp.]